MSRTPRSMLAVISLVILIGFSSEKADPVAREEVTPVWTDPSTHATGFVMANGVKLNYLDWGGTGPNLILIHGLGDNPHVFDDMIPALGGQFRIVAYARRGHGRSSKVGPFDTATLTAAMPSIPSMKLNRLTNHPTRMTETRMSIQPTGRVMPITS